MISAEMLAQNHQHFSTAMHSSFQLSQFVSTQETRNQNITLYNFQKIQCLNYLDDANE